MHEFLQIKYVRASSDQYSVEQSKLRNFENLLFQLDQLVITSKVFESCLSRDYSLSGTATSKVCLITFADVLVCCLAGVL